MDIETWAGATTELSSLVNSLARLKPEVPSTNASIYDLTRSVSSFGTRTDRLRRGEAAAPTAAERVAFCRCGLWLAVAAAPYAVCCSP